jgi:hypothetical protein
MKAMELGIVPRTEEAAGEYGSLEEAMKAGAPVEQPRLGGDQRDLAMMHERGLPDRMTAREAIAREYARLPDFTKVGGINLILDVLYVDGMEFPVPKADADEFRLYAITIANAAIVRKLNEAVAALTGLVSKVTVEAVDAGTAGTVAGEGMLEVPGDETTQ